MRKLVLLSFVALMLLVASCKKSSPGLPANTSSVSFDNAVYNLNTIYADTAYYSVTHDTLIWSVSITTPDTTAAMFLTLVATKSNQLTGNYGVLNDTSHLGYIVFLPGVTPEYNGGTNIGGTVVNVSSMSLTNLQGKVSGYIYLNGDNTQPPRPISASFNIVR
jgi:hypothetical protein